MNSAMVFSVDEVTISLPGPVLEVEASTTEWKPVLADFERLRRLYLSAHPR